MMTPTEIENEAREVSIDCLRSIRRHKATGDVSDRDIREIIEQRVERALRKAALGSESR